MTDTAHAPTGAKADPARIAAHQLREDIADTHRSLTSIASRVNAVFSADSHYSARRDVHNALVDAASALRHAAAVVELHARDCVGLDPIARDGHR